MANDPGFRSNVIVRELQRAQNQQQNVRNNSARLAWSYNRFQSNGSGEYLHPTPVTFDCTFIFQPDVAYGYSLLNDNLVPGRFPRPHGGVRSWVTTPKGWYIGAWLYFVIDTQGPDTNPGSGGAPPSYDIEHYFQFCGTAIKDVNTQLLRTQL